MELDKIEIDANQEIVITLGNLGDIIKGLSHISAGMEKIEGKITNEESRDILLSLVATFVSVAKLFPKKQKNQIFADMKEMLGIDLLGKI